MARPPCSLRRRGHRMSAAALMAAAAVVAAAAAAVGKTASQAAAGAPLPVLRLATLIPHAYEASSLMTSLVSVMRLAQEDVNRDAHILPGHRIELDLLPLAQAPQSLTGLTTLCRAFLAPQLKGKDGETVASGPVNPPIHGILGPFTSPVASGLASVVSAAAYNVPTLSPTALIADTRVADLDEAAAEAATTFRRLLLLLPGGADAHARALLGTVRAMKHYREGVRYEDSATAALLVHADAEMPERIGILYSTDAYGQGGLHAILTAVHKRRGGVVMATDPTDEALVDGSAAVEVVVALPLNVNEPETVLAQFAAASPRVIIVWALLLGGRAVRLFREAEKVGLVNDQHQWILSDGGTENDIWDVPVTPDAEAAVAANDMGDERVDGSASTADSGSFVIDGIHNDETPGLISNVDVTVERDTTMAIRAIGTLAIRQASLTPNLAAEVFERRWRGLNATDYPGAGTDMLRSQVLDEYLLFGYDAVVAMARALDKVIRDRGGVAPEGFSLSPALADPDKPVAAGTECVWGSPWEAGNELAAALAATDFHGASGRVTLDELDGIRSKAQGGFSVLNLQTRGGDAVWVPIANGSYTDALPAGALDNAYTTARDGRIDYFDFTSGAWLQSLPSAWQQFPGGSTSRNRQYPYDRASLRGRQGTLRVIVKPLAPFVQLDERRSGNDRFFGVSVDVLLRMAEELAFTVELFAAPEGMGTSEVLRSMLPGGRIPVHQFGGAGSASLASNASAEAALDSDEPYDAKEPQFDMAIGAISITSARAANVSFTTPYWQSALQVMVRGSATSTSPWRFLAPLDLRVWALVVALTVAYGLLMMLFEGTREVGNADFRDRSALSSMALSIWHAAMVAVGGRQFVAAKTAEGRLVTVAFVTGVLVVAMAYTAELGAFLSTEAVASVQLSSVEDIRSGVLPLHRIAVLAGGASEEWLLREVAGGGIGGDITGRAAVGGKPYLTCTVPEECESLLFRQIGDGWLTDRPLLEVRLGPSCIVSAAVCDDVWDGVTVRLGGDGADAAALLLCWTFVLLCVCQSLLSAPCGGSPTPRCIQYRTGTTSCNLSVVPVQLTQEGYGFVLPAPARVSVLRELNTAILQLSEKSILARLKATYFVDDCLDQETGEGVEAEAITSHTIIELSGLFILLGVFMVCAVLLRLLRFYW